MSKGATCEWYALCENEADGVVDHPILGKVPTCRRCAEKHELILGSLHQYDGDTDRCACGGQILYYEGNLGGEVGYGCEAAGKAMCGYCEGTPNLRHTEGCER